MPDVVTAQSDGDDEAFQRLYPDQHYDRFLDNGLRPDGRIAGLARETTIGLGTVTSADSSALVKVELASAVDADSCAAPRCSCA